LKGVQRLVENGISVQSVDYDLRTPLHVAIAGRHQEVVRYLLEHGAELHAEDRFGGTPFEEAHRAGVRLGNDPILNIVSGFGGEQEHSSWKTSFSNPFFLTFFTLEIIIGILYAIFSYYAHTASAGSLNELGYEEVMHRIPFYMDVHVMIFIGFGFLMTFLRKYGYTAVGLTFIIGALAIQVFLLFFTFWTNIIESASPWNKLEIDIELLINADFAAGAVLISFGALLGKVSFTQMLLLTVLEVFFYTLNQAVCLKLAIADIGGSMVIHTFGAFFGLAASAVLTPSAARGNKDNAAVYHSDLFSMIGSIFLWIYWPSFNGALSSGNAQHRAVINTVLSLTASVIFAFLFSQFWRKERVFNMVDIQNATLAGGVAMGSAADMAVHPAFALLIGAIAGTISVFGFSKLQGLVESHLHIHDTCGVLNLHGIPGILGAVVSIIASAAASGDAYSFSQLTFIWWDRDQHGAAHQAKLQLAFLVITLGISIITGLFSGILLSKCSYPKKFFVDSQSWETPSRETPYFFDKRGEARHSNERPNAEAPQGAASAAVVAAEGQQLNDLQNKISQLENMLRSQRATLRAQARAIEGMGGRATMTASGRDLEPEDTQSLLRAPVSPSYGQSRVPPSGPNFGGGNQNQNLATMLEALAAKVNFLVEKEKSK
jgi:ammonium transporter Rh